MGLPAGDRAGVVAIRGRRLRQVPIGPFAALFSLYLLLGIFVVIPRITADGVAYYAETRSLIFDGDLDLANEFAVPIETYSPLGDAGPRAIVPRDLDGSFRHDVNLGIVVLLGPFLLVAHAVAGIVGAVSTGLGAAAPFAMDGFSPIYVLAVSFGSNALVAAGLGLLAAHLAALVGRGVAIAAAARSGLGVRSSIGVRNDQPTLMPRWSSSSACSSSSSLRGAVLRATCWPGSRWARCGA